MDSTELSALQARLRLSYEWSRLWRAVLGFLPCTLFIAAAAILTSRPGSTLLFGAGLFLLASLLLWYGRDLRRAVLPGFVAGLVPLTLSLCANHLGHVCTGERCVMLCLPACTIGGLAAGLGVSAIGHRGRRGLGFWVAASAVCLLTGAMGCSCIGYSGVTGLGLGFLAGLVPGLVRRFSR